MIEKILMKLLIMDPYYGYLAQKVNFKENNEIKRIKLKFSRTAEIHYNEEWFGELTESLAISSIVHELIHLALLHFYRRGQREVIMWNIACDIATTELMKNYEIHDDIITRKVIKDEIGIQLKENMNAEYYYKELVDKKNMFHLINNNNEATFVFEGGHEYQGEILDENMNDDLSMDALINELSIVQFSASKEGSIQNELLTDTKEVYRPYQVNWRNVLKRFLSGHGKVKTRKSYKRQSRRFDDLPGKKRSVGVRVLLAIDESASINDSYVEAFHKELIQINKITGADITAVRFDTECSEPVPLHQFLTMNKRERRGGTDFHPVFELADSLKVPLVIVFTDGEGEAPTTVDQNVLWVLVNEGVKPADYGISVDF